MISQGTTSDEGLDMCNKVRRIVKKDPYMDWGQLLKKVEGIV